MTTDTLRRFILDSSHVRGSWVNLEQAWLQLIQRTEYPDTIKTLLGEALAAVTLLSTTIKHNGTMILQIRGDGPVHLLVVQINHQGEVRGLAQWTQEPPVDANLIDTFGQGHFAITLNSDIDTQPYQGIITLEGSTIAQALENYFARSEQLPSKIHLAVGTKHVAGLLIQRLPGQSSVEDWQRATLLLETVTQEELLQLSSEALIYRLFHEEQPRVFPVQTIKFACPCNLERIERMLISLGEAETKNILQEQGKIEVTCEFCNAHYEFDSIDVAHLFNAQSVLPNNTLH